jgi:hypothetical protein
MLWEANAGFYSNPAWGLLPVAWSRVPAYEFRVWQITRAYTPNRGPSASLSRAALNQ